MRTIGEGHEVGREPVFEPGVVDQAGGGEPVRLADVDGEPGIGEVGDHAQGGTRLEELESLRQRGLISDEEHALKKKEILSHL